MLDARRLQDARLGQTCTIVAECSMHGAHYSDPGTVPVVLRADAVATGSTVKYGNREGAVEARGAQFRESAPPARAGSAACSTFVYPIR
jgi:hypothetical protein